MQIIETFLQYLYKIEQNYYKQKVLALQHLSCPATSHEWCFVHYEWEYYIDCQPDDQKK